MRCRGTTRKGERCQRIIPKGKEYCFLHSPKGIKNEIKAAIIISIGGTLAVLIPIIYGVISYKPKSDLIDVSPYLYSYGFSTVCPVDIKLKNNGRAVSYIKRIKINVLENHTFDYDPSPTALRFPATATYNISLSDLKRGESKEFNTSHVIPGGETDRIILVLGGNKVLGSDISYLSRITLTIIADYSTQLTSKSIDILVLNHDEGKQIPFEDKKIKKFIEKEALPILTRDDIQRHLKKLPIIIPLWFTQV